MAAFRNALIFCAAFAAASCAGKNVFNDCKVTGAEFSKSGVSGLSLRFTDSGSCDYRLIKETSSDWTIELPSGKFGDFRPAADKFASGILLSAAVEKTRFRIILNRDMDVSRAAEGKRAVFIMKNAVPVSAGAASYVTSAVCSPGGVPFLVRVNSDGIAAYELGLISSGKGYLDIFEVSLAEKFSISPACAGIVSASEADFPERVRFIITDSLVASMKASGAGTSVEVSPKEGLEAPYILKIIDGSEGVVQTIKVYTSFSVKPQVETLTGGEISVALGKSAGLVSGLPKASMLAGPAFSSVRVEDRGNETVLLFRSPISAANVDVYVEKTGYGFVLYAKKLM